MERPQALTIAGWLPGVPFRHPPSAGAGARIRVLKVGGNHTARLVPAGPGVMRDVEQDLEEDITQVRRILRRQAWLEKVRG